MLKTYNTIIKTVLVLGMCVLPISTFAGPTGNTSSGSFGSGWNYGSGSYSTPTSYSTGSYYPSSSSGWNYGSGSYSTPTSYSTPSYSGYSYTPSSYSYTPSYGTSYSRPSYSGSSYVPSTYSYVDRSSSVPASSYSYSSSNPSTKSNATNNTTVNTSSSASASSSNTNINNNVNNVYVYTNPSGNAVIHNPEYQRLDGYCIITPSNPRVGQTVTATAYMTGGIGNYTYTWGGDLAIGATGVSTSFTSYTAGTKNITVTARSDQDVVTKNCTVTFYDNPIAVNSYSYSNYGGSVITSGSPVSGVFVQPGQIKKTITSGTAVSGVYLNELPATGMDLGIMEYIVGFMVIVLASVAYAISKAKKSFSYSIEE